MEQQNNETTSPTLEPIIPPQHQNQNFDNKCSSEQLVPTYQQNVEGQFLVQNAQIVPQIVQKIQKVSQEEFLNNNKEIEIAQQKLKEIGIRKEIIERIKSKKARTLRQLNDVSKKQDQLRKSIQTLQKSRNKTMQASYYSPQQKQKVRQILKMQKLQQIRQTIKNDQIARRFSDYVKQERLSEQNKIQKIRQQHRRQVLKSINSLEIRQKSREQFKKEIQQRTTELKNKKYIHIQKSMKDLQNEEIKKSQDQRKLKQLKQKFKINFKDISQHDKNYKSLLIQKSEQRKFKFNTQAGHSFRKYPQTKFSQILEVQENQRRTAELKKLNMAVQSRQKVNEFKNYVKQKFLPKRSTTLNSASSSPPSQCSKRALSHVERVEKGNEYLAVAKKRRKQKDDPRIFSEPQVRKYMDYLKGVQNKQKCKTMQKFKKIVSESSIDFPEANQAWSLVQQIQAKSKRGKDQKLFDSIQNKIDLLKALL